VSKCHEIFVSAVPRHKLGLVIDWWFRNGCDSGHDNARFLLRYCGINSTQGFIQRYVTYQCLKQWCSTTILRVTCGSQTPFVRPSAVFNKIPNILCNRLRSAMKQNVSIDLCSNFFRCDTLTELQVWIWLRSAKRLRSGLKTILVKALLLRVRKERENCRRGKLSVFDRLKKLVAIGLYVNSVCN